MTGGPRSGESAAHRAQPPARPNIRWLIGVIVIGVVVGGIGVLVSSGWLDPRPELWVEDIGEFVVAALAAAACTWRIRGLTGRYRLVWVCLALGCFLWAAGQALWSWYELALGIDTPFPSPADAGFLGFSVLACAALLAYPVADGVTASFQRILDASMTTVAVGLLSWVLVLDPVVRTSEYDGLGMAVLVAYPLGDVLVLVLTILVFTRTRGTRASLTLLAGGLIALSVSDSLFAYLTATSDYTGGGVDLGWFAGFLLIALAALIPDNPRTVPEPAQQIVALGEEPLRKSRRQMTWDALPYLPVLLAMAVTIGQSASGNAPSIGELSTTAAVVALALVRQYLTVKENAALSGRLAVREAQLRQQAFHDGLTGLANRALFRDRLVHALDLHARDLRQVSVMFLDLDDFKIVNDTMGHARGDELLVRVAERLRGAVRTGDTVARLGGDEFAVLLEDGGDPLSFAAKVHDVLKVPFVVAGRQIDVSASVGVFALEPADGILAADVLLSRADTAMYAAKRSGKSRIVAYHDGMNLIELEEMRLSEALLTAVRERKVSLVYQPIVDLDSGWVVGLEALARWELDGAPVAPEAFLAAAKRAGILGQLTRDLLDEACARGAAWSLAGRDANAGAAVLAMHVNVAPSQLGAADFVDMVRAALDKHQLPAAGLVLEITESGIFADHEAAGEAITDLRRIGVMVALDDFGIGYSSLAQLQAIELDTVKIDSSFVDRLDTDPRQVTFLGALLRLARDVGLKVIAEGVERPGQLEILRSAGCTIAQGYLLGRPMGEVSVPEVLRHKVGAAYETSSR